MKKYYINYADNNHAFKRGQKFALEKAKLAGGFDDIVGYGREEIDAQFYEDNKSILEQAKGGGYWLWKPYFINKRLSEIEDGDYLFYGDAGSFFLKSVDILIEELEKVGQDIMVFESPYLELQWTKRELFKAMECDEDFYKNSNQLMGGFQLIKKTPFTVKFYKELLQYSCNEINLTDRNSPCVDQDESYIEHRHDQSILSLLYKKYRLRGFKDATQFGEHPAIGCGMKKIKFKKNKLYKLENGRMFFAHDYPETYRLVLFNFRRDKPLKHYVKYRIRAFFGVIFGKQITKN